jgi:pyruvate/2-oxoglutarate dehydrogenase complex dihydrolipoamide dehydrogenase (E3) component
VELNTEVTPEVVAEIRPDSIVVATGGLPATSAEIPGMDQDHVVCSWDVLMGRVMPGLKVLVIRGGTTGCETADFMAHPVDDSNPKGTRVTVLEMLDHMMPDDLSPRRSLLIQRLQSKGVRMITEARVTEILKDGVKYLQRGEEKVLRGMDTIVLAMGTRPNTVLRDKLQGSSIAIFVIGDAKVPRKAVDAIAEGSEVGRLV